MRQSTELRALRMQIEKLRSEAEGVKAMTLSDMPKGGKSRGTEDAIADIVDLQALCAGKLETLVQDRHDAMTVIMRIERTELRTVLTLYYCDGQSWDEVAEETGYSVRQVLRLHGEALIEFAAKAKNLHREETDFSELCIGLKCGGSDAYSGLTANPLVGKITDKIIGAGGSAILTEIPEMFGAEQLLMNKCKTEKVYTAVNL